MSTSKSGNRPIVIVGGGLVGLSAGLFLQHLGIPFVLIEQNVYPTSLPRSRGIHVRTMELFRQIGIEKNIQAAAASAWEMGVFGGGRRGRTLLDSVPLQTDSIERLTGADPSPCSFCACPQTLIEPVLRRHLEERGGDVRFGCELVSFCETGDGLEVTVRNNGMEVRIEASYLIGADGGRSFVRSRLGIETDGVPAQQYFVNLFFRADLTDRVRGRTFSQCQIANDRVRGLFLSKNNTTEWSFHLEYDPSVAAPLDCSNEELTDFIRAAVGAKDLSIEILSKTAWSTAVRIANHYRVGRVFLAGDAAHVMPPWGGFNANTGIADVHNLAWKLAATLGGQEAPDLLASYPDLLASYEEERRPVAVRNSRQALLRTDFDARFGIETEANREEFAQLLETGALLMHHRYTTGNIGSQEHWENPVDRLCGQTGTRFPHAWITRGTDQISTLDLFGTGYVLIAGPGASPCWAQDLVNGLSQDSLRLYVTGVDFKFADGNVNWAMLTSLPDDGAILVRPDGFVAGRSDERLHPVSGLSFVA